MVSVDLEKRLRRNVIIFANTNANGNLMPGLDSLTKDCYISERMQIEEWTDSYITRLQYYYFHTIVYFLKCKSLAMCSHFKWMCQRCFTINRNLLYFGFAINRNQIATKQLNMSSILASHIIICCYVTCLICALHHNWHVHQFACVKPQRYMLVTLVNLQRARCVFLDFARNLSYCVRKQRAFFDLTSPTQYSTSQF